MAYSDFRKFADSFQSIARLGLESITELLNQLGNPQNSLKFIHIAGTNGKGSVCAFLQEMLTHAGYKTGKYTSPNMLDVTERINIDGKNATDEVMHELSARVTPACDKVLEVLGAYPTQFEIWTAMAICRFADEKCDFVVWETGLGGTRDATNVVTTTVLEIITKIALDHTEYLGNTLADIAGEKAGIIKQNTKVITISQSDEALDVIKKVCHKKSAELIVADVPNPNKFSDIYEIIEYKGITVKLSLGGINQIENAVCAINAALTLGIDKACIKYGLENAINPGRFERITKNIYYDGAHNPNGVNALCNNIKRYFGKKPCTFIMATMSDKDITSSLKMLNFNDAEFKTVTVKDNPRSMDYNEFAKLGLSLGLRAKSYFSLKQALIDALTENKIIILCGSLYLYKDFKEIQSEVL